MKEWLKKYWMALAGFLAASILLHYFVTKAIPALAHRKGRYLKEDFANLPKAPPKPPAVATPAAQQPAPAEQKK